jgi:protein-L-isoaspartate(D-aspartate) O-methyltransferase
MNTENFSLARQKMVEGQIVPSGVIDAALVDALQNLPRERFVPGDMRSVAYIDEHIPVGRNRFLLSPLLLAKLLVLAEVAPTDRVLDIGAATGYSTAVLSGMASHVIAVEKEKDLAEFGRAQWHELQLTNVEMIVGCLSDGYAGGAHYDLVLINGAIQTLPQKLMDQLIEGGRIVSVQNTVNLPGTKAGFGKATLWRKYAGKLSPYTAFDASVPLLEEFEEKKEFIF